MDWIVALNNDTNTMVDSGTVAESDVIYVEPGKVALVSVYGFLTEYQLSPDKKQLTTKGCLDIYKVSLGDSTEEIKALACECSTRNLQAELRRVMDSRQVTKSPVFTCGNSWSFSSCDNLVALAVPGYYVLRLNDVNQLTDIRVEYAIIDSSQASSIPDKVFAGTPCCS